MAKKIFIDPGHGGNDPGACGNGLQEKVVNLNVAKSVEHHLKRHGVTVIMSRTTDTNPYLTQRSSAANSNNVDASISIHCNAFNGQAKGIETFTYGTGTNELRLANCVHNKIISAGLYSANRGVKQGNLHMVREPKMAAILIELAFIDNANDAQLLKNKQEEFAVAIAKGILEYVGITWKNETVTQPATSNTLYRVMAGSYSSRGNANKQVERLKALGIDATIMVFYK